jgi:hypothetical protein
MLSLLRKVIITGLTDHNVLIFNHSGPKAGVIENPVNQIFSLYLLFKPTFRSRLNVGC